MSSITTFPYKNVLTLGATSGIGLALAEKMIEHGIFVIAAGRRKENLQSFVSKHGSDKAASFTFDITNLEEIPSFADKSPKHNQRSLNFRHPQSIDLDAVQAEYTTNYVAPLHLTKAFLPFLQSQSTPTALIFTTSGLAVVPVLRCPGCCAAKAAMHQMILVLREQLKGSNVKVVEILPPAVRTELHDAKHQPDIKDGGNIGISQEEFTGECWAGLASGKENIPVGKMTMGWWAWEEENIKKFEKAAEAMTPKM